MEGPHINEIWHYTVTQVGDTCTVALAGELDMSGAGELTRVLVEAVNRPGARTLQVDVDAVSFIDSSGLRALIVAHLNANASGRSCTVIRAHGPVLTLLRVAELLPILCPDSAGDPPSPPTPRAGAAETGTGRP